MIIELSYWDMFWAGVTVGCVLCVPVILSVVNFRPMSAEDKQEIHDMKTLGYLPVPEFRYQPTQYFKYVPVKDLRIGNQGEMPSKPTSEMPKLKKPKK